MKRSLINTLVITTLLSPALVLAKSANDSNKHRFQDTSVNISTLSHQHYLGENSKASHFWHGEDDGAISFKATGGNDAVITDSNYVHPDLTAHSQKFDKGLYKINDNIYQLWGYGLTTPVVIDGDEGLIVLDPMESADKMREAIKVFREQTGNKKPITGIVYSHWHMDHFGGVRGLDNIADDVKIIVHDTFMNNVINNTMGGLGPAIGFRVDYSLGTLLAADEKGRINGGLGPDFLVKELTLITPNTFVEGQWGKLEIEISGVKMEVAHIPSESADEIVVYLKDENILWGAEVIQGESFPNLHTIRGTRYRDPQNWYPGIDVLRDYQADIYLGAHSRPINGAKHVQETLTAYRDAIQFTYDQSIKAINNGATAEDLIRDIQLPAHLQNHPFLGDFYGSIRHSAKQVFTGELGWFDGDPTTLNPIHSSEASKRYVKLMGGKEKVVQFAIDACDQQDFQWCAELATHAIRIDLDDMQPRLLKAEALRELAYQETNNNWRNWYLTAATELDNSIDRSLKFPMSAPDLFETYSEGQLVGAMRFNLNAQKSADQHYTIAFKFADSVHALEVRRGIAQFHQDFTGSATATVNISRELFIGILLGKVDFLASAQKGLITIDGDVASVPKFFDALDTPTNTPALVVR